MGRLNRRRFIRTGIAGAGMAAISPSLVASIKTARSEDIIYRTLGRTGLKVPVISFGVMRSDNPGLCKAAYEKGIKLFDTANVYQGGNNETMLGNLFKDYPRDSFLLATKVKPGTDRGGNITNQTSADKFLEDFGVSLSRLQMDYVDILYVHDVSNPEVLEYKPIINAVNKLKKEGKVRFSGFSTHRNEATVIDAAANLGIWDVILTVYNYRMAAIDEMNASIKKAAGAGIGIVAMKTIAGGGFLDRERTIPMNTTAAIKWVLSNPNVHTTIPGMTNFDELELNGKILTDITLTDEEKSDLLAESNEPGLFCSGCRKCVALCPHNLPIPELMRAYMYTYGYMSPSMAKSLLEEIGINGDPCSTCETCTVSCTNNFKIREKIADVSRLVNIPGEFLA